MNTPDLTPSEESDLRAHIENTRRVISSQAKIGDALDACWIPCMSGSGVNNGLGKLDGGKRECWKGCVDRWVDSSVVIMKRMQEKGK